MRAYIDIDGINIACSIDCITMVNNKTDETLNLSFDSVDCNTNDKGISLRLKEEEEATFGLPDSLKEKFGNNKETYKFIKNSTISSIVIVPLFDEELDLLNAKLTGLEIQIGEKRIDYSEEEMKEILLEDGEE